MRIEVVVAVLALYWSPGCHPGEDQTGTARPAGLLPLPPLPDLASLDPSPRQQLRERHAATASLLRAADVPPSSLGRAYGKLGEIFHAYMDLESARTCYLNARTQSPAVFRWAYLLGHVERTLGNYTAATGIFEQALSLRPRDVPTLVWLGEIELEQHRLQRARGRFHQALDVDPRCYRALVGRAQVAIESADYARAVEDLEKALAAQPRASRIHYALGLAYRSLGETQRARTHLQQAISPASIPIAFEDPLMEEVGDLRSSVQVYIRRGMMAAGRGRFDAAVREFELAVAANPDRPYARYNLASALLRLGRRREAQAHLDELMERNPDYALSRVLLARVLAGDGDYARAEEHLRRALELDPDSERGHLALGDLLRGRGRLEEALVSCRRAQELGPGLAPARFGVARALVDLERYGQALASVQESASALPDRRGLRLLLARLLATIPEDAQRDGPRALEIASQAIDADETVAAAETVAMALAGLGRFNEAVRWQKKALGLVEGIEGEYGWVRERLSLYEREMPCRRPWAAGEALAREP